MISLTKCVHGNVFVLEAKQRGDVNAFVLSQLVIPIPQGIKLSKYDIVFYHVQRLVRRVESAHSQTIENISVSQLSADSGYLTLTSNITGALNTYEAGAFGLLRVYVS